MKPLSLVLAMSLLAPAALSQSYLDQARAAAQPLKLDNWQLRQTLRIGGEDQSYVTQVMYHDPSRSDGEHWIVEEDFSDDDRSTSLDIDTDIIDYADVVRGLDGEASLLRENEETAVYALQNVDVSAFTGDTVQLGNADLDDLDIHITVRKQSPAGPFVERVVALLPEGKGQSLLADVEKMDMVFQFQAHDTGVILPRSFNFLLEGDALWFFDFNVAVDIAYSDFVYVGGDR